MQIRSRWDVFISVITIVNLLKSIRMVYSHLPNALLKYSISANTCIREFGICQHGSGKNWRRTGTFKYLKKKLLAQGLSFKRIMKTRRRQM